MADGGDRAMTDRERALTVRRLRDEGLSLSAIGRALGITRQAVTKSLGREVPEARPDVTLEEFVSKNRKRKLRAKTINIQRMSKRELERGRMEYPPAETTDLYSRPTTRGECLNGEHAQRPCPFASCVHHAFLDVDESTGSIKINYPPADDSAEALVAVLHAMPHTCSLDVADEGGATLDFVGSMLSVSRERCRQIEVDALVKITRRSAAASLGDYLSDDALPMPDVRNAHDDRASAEAPTSTALDTLPRVVRVLPSPPPAQERPTLDAEGRALASLGMLRTDPRRIVSRASARVKR